MHTLLNRAGTAVVVLDELFSTERNISVPDSLSVKMLSVSQILNTTSYKLKRKTSYGVGILMINMPTKKRKCCGACAIYYVTMYETNHNV